MPKDFERKIHMIRDEYVMLSPHLAKLYKVKAKTLIQAVKRNIERFPSDFMFQLDKIECANLKSQFVTSSWGGARRAYPYAFTEMGVAMLSSVLRSKTAIRVNIGIMRTFAKLRKMIVNNKDLALRMNEAEHRIGKHDEKITLIFSVIEKLMEPPPQPPKRQIGFTAG